MFSISMDLPFSPRSSFFVERTARSAEVLVEESVAPEASVSTLVHHRHLPDPESQFEADIHDNFNVKNFPQ